MAKLEVPKGYEAWKQRVLRDRLALAEKHRKDEKRKNRYIVLRTTGV